MMRETVFSERTGLELTHTEKQFNKEKNADRNF